MSQRIATKVVSYQEDSSSDDDIPLAKRGRTSKSGVKVASDSEDDLPLAGTPKHTNGKALAERTNGNGKARVKREISDSEDESVKAPKKRVKKESDSGSESDFAPEPVQKRKSTPAKNGKASAKSQTPKKETPKKSTVKKEGGASAKVKKESAKTKTKKETENAKENKETPKAEDDEDTFRWWEVENDGTTKWTTLEHNGVMFPPEYEPHGVKMLYEGQPVTLSPEGEEVASFFAAILETDYAKNPVFCKNFFKCFLEVLEEHPQLSGPPIKDFERCNFRPMWEYLEAEKQKKKSLTSAEKKKIKEARQAEEEPYKYCLLDGRREMVGNFRVEPPGLFRGRGEHPKTGMLKTRVLPEQITLNIGADAKIPEPPAGHRWKSVVHDDKVSWLATWKENINGAVKYVFLAANSSLKGQSDYKKFEKARALKDHIARIREDYTADLTAKETAVRQRATAIYLIDRFALRNGNEKGEDEADTVGCCSLRYEHVTLTPPNIVTFDFLGKDSIRYVNEVKVDAQVFKNLKIFKKEPKTVGDLLFDRLTTSAVNKYLNAYMDGLTAKVFRTYNASQTFVEQLALLTRPEMSLNDKILAYNRANRLVAVLCNHQRAVPKTHTQTMERLGDKVRALKYQRRKLRAALVAADRKTYKRYIDDDESGLDEEWIDRHEADLVVQEGEKITKKFDRENAKRVESGEPPLPAGELKERLKAVGELEKQLKADRKKGWKESRFSAEKLEQQIIKLDARILAQKTLALDRDEGKEVSLGTSKINYIDPRITFDWCRRHDVPATKMFSKTLIEKFKWAQEMTEAEEDFKW